MTIPRPFSVTFTTRSEGDGDVFVRDATNRLIVTMSVAYNAAAKSVTLGEVRVIQRAVGEDDDRLAALGTAAIRALDFALSRNMLTFYAIISPNMVELAEFAMGSRAHSFIDGKVELRGSISALKTRLESAIRRSDGVILGLTAVQKDRINANLTVLTS